MSLNSNLPFVTIVTVSYNAEETIENTILSVINQDYENLEYIVVDGGSTDGTVSIIKKYENKISKWISEKDEGIYDAMNKGILMSHGEWINFRNCGDLFAERNSLSKVFYKPYDEDVMIIHGDCYKTCEYGYKVSRPQSLSKYRFEMPIIHPATFIRSELHKKWLFDKSYRVAADYNMIYRCIEAGLKFEHVDSPIVIFPSGGFSDQNWRIALADMMRIQKKIYSFSGLLVFLLRYIYIYLNSKLSLITAKLFKGSQNKGWVSLPLPVEKFY